MKNPENKPLRLVPPETDGTSLVGYGNLSSKHLRTPNVEYVRMLCSLAIAESNLVAAGKSSALPHFIAIVKELERIFGFSFQQVNNED